MHSVFQQTGSVVHCGPVYLGLPYSVPEISKKKVHALVSMLGVSTVARFISLEQECGLISHITVCI